MTVVVLRKSERFDKSGKMFFSGTDNLSEADKQQQRWCEESQSRVSFPPEDGLSSESSLCWTMRTAAHSGHHYPQYQSQRSNRLSTQKSSSNLSSSSSVSHSSSSHSSSLSFSSSDKMFDKSIQKSIGILSGSTIAKLFSSSGAGKSCSHSHYYPKLTSPSTESLLPSSKSQKSYHHHHHSWASFGMILITVIILSTFSTSSTVMCVPLGGSANGGVGEARRAAGGPGLMMGLTPSKMMELHRKLQQNSEQQSQGEIHLPSVHTQGSGGAVAEQTVEHSNLHHNSNYPSNYHLNKQQSPIQKLHHKDFTRSILENTGDDVEDDDEVQDASKEMNNEVETMIAPQPISSSSSLRNLGRITLADAGVGGGDEEPNSTGDLVDRSSAAAGEDESSGQWETVIDPHLYVLTEWNSNPFQRRQQQQQQQFSMFRQQRKRRNSGTGPSLSIVNPLDVLRQRLLLEIARRRMRQSHNQIIANEEILRKIGRR